MWNSFLQATGIVRDPNAPPTRVSAADKVFDNINATVSDPRRRNQLLAALRERTPEAVSWINQQYSQDMAAYDARQQAPQQQVAAASRIQNNNTNSNNARQQQQLRQQQQQQQQQQIMQQAQRADAARQVQARALAQPKQRPQAVEFASGDVAYRAPPNSRIIYQRMVDSMTSLPEPNRSRTIEFYRTHPESFDREFSANYKDAYSAWVRQHPLGREAAESRAAQLRTPEERRLLEFESKVVTGQDMIASVKDSANVAYVKAADALSTSVVPAVKSSYESVSSKANALNQSYIQPAVSSVSSAAAPYVETASDWVDEKKEELVDYWEEDGQDLAQQATSTAASYGYDAGKTAAFNAALGPGTGTVAQSFLGGYFDSAVETLTSSVLAPIAGKVSEYGEEAAGTVYDYYKEKQAEQAEQAELERRQARAQRRAAERQADEEQRALEVMLRQERQVAQMDSLKAKWGIPASRTLTEEEGLALINNDEDFEWQRSQSNVLDEDELVMQMVEAELIGQQQQAARDAKRPNDPVLQYESLLDARHNYEGAYARSGTADLNPNQQSLLSRLSTPEGFLPNIYRSDAGNVLMQQDVPGVDSLASTYNLMLMADKLDAAQRANDRAAVDNLREAFGASGIYWG